MKRHPVLQANAQELRKAPTPAEKALWKILRGRKLGGFKFRRQHTIEPYIADFCCPAAKVIVEMDGDSHIGQEQRDERREAYLRQAGYAIVRFLNCEAFDRPEWVAEMVLRACQTER